MSSEQILPTGDIRSAAQDYKRDAARKHKWAMGEIKGAGRPIDNPRPRRPSETAYNFVRKESKAGVASLQHGTKIARKFDMLEGVTSVGVSDASDSNSDLDEVTTSPAPDAGVMYSFDATRGPSHGSQILNLALAKAEQRFKDKETVTLVTREYDVLDSEGESIGLTPVKNKSKGKGIAKVGSKDVQSDEEYEFV